MNNAWQQCTTAYIPGRTDGIFESVISILPFRFHT